METTLIRAEKDQFAVFHTIYSNADIEMWFDWNLRLNDTKWTDQCFFLLIDGQKAGGAIITDKVITCPFLVPPFCDRTAFWRAVLKQQPRDRILGLLEGDAAILPMFGYKADSTSQVMCRPADCMASELPRGFICRPVSIGTDADAIGAVISQSYAGGICEAINGPTTPESSAEDTKKVLAVYTKKDFSHVIVEQETGSIVAVCLAGIGENYIHGSAEIAEICVLPQSRGHGLAKHMISRVVTDSVGIAPYVKLFVHVGNSAEYLYREMGFAAGPRFTNMSKRN